MRYSGITGTISSGISAFADPDNEILLIPQTNSATGRPLPDTHHAPPAVINDQSPLRTADAIANEILPSPPSGDKNQFNGLCATQMNRQTDHCLH